MVSPAELRYFQQNIKNKLLLGSRFYLKLKYKSFFKLTLPYWWHCAQSKSWCYNTGQLYGFLHIKEKKSDYYILCRDTKRNYSEIIKTTFGSTLLSYQLSILDKRFAFAFENVFASLPTQICTVSTWKFRLSSYIQMKYVSALQFQCALYLCDAIPNHELLNLQIREI